MSQFKSFGAGPVYVREDVFGRVFFDKCATDAQHAVAPADSVKGKRTCRTYVEDFFKEALDRRGLVAIDFWFKEEPVVIEMVAEPAAEGET